MMSRGFKHLCDVPAGGRVASYSDGADHYLVVASPNERPFTVNIATGEKREIIPDWSNPPPAGWLRRP